MTVYEANIERLLPPTAAADVVISNGAINLAQDKDAVFREMYRALRPGGRIQFADVMRRNGCCCGTTMQDDTGPIAWPARCPLNAISNCGARQAFRTSGSLGWTGYSTAANTEGATFHAKRASTDTA